MCCLRVVGVRGGGGNLGLVEAIGNSSKTKGMTLGERGKRGRKIVFCLLEDLF